MEDRTLFAWNLTLGGSANRAPTTNVSASTVAGTTTFTADGTGANLNWNDVYSALAAGENVVIDSGSTGTEAGNVTDISGYQLKPLSGSDLSLTIQSGGGSGLVGNISIANVTLDGTHSSVILDANGSVSTGYLGGGTISNPVPLASVRITAVNGSIDSQAFPFVGPVYATTVALQSSTGIGSASDWLWTETSSLSALTSTGGMYISNSGSLTLNDGVLPGVNGVHVTTSGDINLSVAGDLTIDTNGDNVSGPGNDSLETFGGGNIVLGGNNGNSFDSFTGAVASTGGTVTLKAAGNLLVGDTSNGTYGHVVSGGNILLGAGGNISIDNGSVVSAHGTGAITATAGGNLSVLHTDALPTNLATQGGAITLSTGAGGTLTVNGAGTFYGNQHTISTTRNGGNGNITIHADHFALDLSDDDIVAGTGTVSIQPVTAAEGIQLGTTTDAELDLSNLELMRITAGTLQVGSMADTGGISITAPVSAFNAATLTLMTGGSILDAAPSNYLAGNNLALEVGGSIGTPAAPITTGVRNIAVRAINSTGGVAVTNSGTNLNVGFASEPFYGVSSGGDVSLTNQGGISVTDGVTSTGKITLNALGPTSDISVPSGGNVSADKGVVAHADRDVLVSGPSGIISSASGNIVVTAGRDVVVNNSSQITTDFGLNGSVSVSAGRNLTIESTGGGKNTLIATSTGSINLATGPGGVFTLNAAAGSQVAKFNPYGPGNITISADDMVIDDPIYAGTGVVTLQQASTAARSIDLGMGTTPGALDLSNAELGQITAGVLRIGRSDNPGNLFVSALVTTPVSVGVLHLITGGILFQSTNAGLVVPNLAVTAAGSVKLGDRANHIANFAANMTDPGSTGNSLTVVNGANTLTVPGGGLDGVVGVTTNNAVISLFADGMNLNAPVNAGSFWVYLEPFTTGRPIILGTKQAGSLALTNAELSNITTGRLIIGDLNANIEFVPITITAPITAPPTWSTLDLFSGTASIQQNSGASITVKNLEATASTGVFLTDPGNTVTNLAGGTAYNAGATFSFVNSTSLNLAELDANVNHDSIRGGGSQTNITALGSGSVIHVNARIDASFQYGSLITLSADEIALNALVVAGYPGTVLLQQVSTTTRGIDLGGGSTAGDLDLSDQELGEIAASELRIGRADNAGNITITAPVTRHPNFQTLSLISGGAVGSTNSVAPDVTATNLAVQAANGISLDTAVSSVAFQNASGAVSIRNTVPLTVGGMDGQSCSNLGVGTTLAAIGQMIFAANVTSAGTLLATTTETDSKTPLPPPDDNLTVNSGVTVQSTAGDVDLRAADGVVVNATGSVRAPAGNINLSCGNGDDDSDGTMSLNGTLASLGTITLNVPAADSAVLTGTATAAKLIENGGGSLYVNGPAGSVNAAVTVNAGTLGGTGKISGTTTVEPGATLAAGNKGPGILTTGTANLSSGSAFAVQLAGPTLGNTAKSYGQLNSSGDVNLNNATLTAALQFVPAVSQTFTIVLAAGKISGQFAQGAFVTLNGITYSIEYLPHSVVLAEPADLSVSIGGPTSAIEGSTASYVYSVSNGGPGGAQNVMLSAPIPSGAVFLSASFGGAFVLPASAYNSSTGVVNLGNLAAGSGGTLTLNVRLPEENPGVTCEAGLASVTGDTNLANNTASLTTIVGDAPLSARGRTVSQGGKSFTNVTVATFSDVNLMAAASDFTANVNWGDGTVTAGQIVANGNGTFSVIASHRYKDAKYKSYSLGVQIVDAGGSTAALTSTAIVIPRPVRQP